MTEKAGTWNKGRENQNKGKKLPPEPLTADEIVKLLQACSKRAPSGIRNKALIVVLWRAGLRISEALTLKPADLDVDRGTINVRHGKGDKSRVVGLDPQAWDVLQRWMDTRAKHHLNGRRRVFCTLEGKPLQASYVRNMLKRLAEKAGIDKRCNPHSLRHTHAVELREEHVDVGIISKQLGHSSIAITSRYLDHVAPKNVIDTMQAREWTE